jgi:hypothetical protein
MAAEPVSCRRAAQLLSQSQERTLRDDEQKALQHHLVLCLRCSDFERQMAFLRKAARLFAER